MKVKTGLCEEARGESECVIMTPPRRIISVGGAVEHSPQICLPEPWCP